MQIIKYTIITLIISLYITNKGFSTVIETDSANFLLIVKQININGNEKTKNQIILNELTFKEGDTISLKIIKSHINHSCNNLLNTPLFNFVTITYQYPIQGYVIFNINVEERWYWWPSVHLNYADRNFNTWLESRDMMRINYGFGLSKYNFRGKNEKIKFFASFGYKQYFSFSYQNINIDKNKRHIVGVDAIFLRKNEVAYNVIKNKEALYKDNQKYIYHLYKYSFSYTYRPRHNITNNFLLNYLSVEINDTVKIMNDIYLYKGQTKQSLMQFEYQLTFDYRDYKMYPLKGWLLQLYYTNYGMSLPMTKGMNIHTVRLKYNHHLQMTDRWYCGAGLTTKINSMAIPFYISEGLGYKENAIRGYEYYIIHGGQMFVSNNYLKYALLPKIVKKINFIPFEKFNKIHFSLYANMFFDFAYVADNFNEYKTAQNSFNDQWLYSTGISLDLVTYYDKTLRIDFSLNHIGEKGIFIHFKAPF